MGVPAIAIVGGGAVVAAKVAHDAPPPTTPIELAATLAATAPPQHGEVLQATPAATLSAGTAVTVRQGGGVRGAIAAATMAHTGQNYGAAVQISYASAAALVGADLHGSSDIESSIVVGMRQIEAQATALYQQALQKLKVAGVNPDSYAGKLVLGAVQREHEQQFAIELDGANKYASALGSASGLDDLAHSLGAEWLWRAKNSLPDLQSVGCERIAPVIAIGLTTGPTGVVILGPAAATGRKRTVYQVGTAVYESAKSGDPEAILTEAGKLAAPYIGRMIGWACSLLVKFGLDKLVKLVDKFAGPVLRVALRLYRASGAKFVVGQLKDFGRASWHAVATGVNKVTGLAGDALDLIGADDAWDAVSGALGDAAGFVGDLNPF